MLRKCSVTPSLLIQTQMTFAFAQFSSSRQETATDLYRKSRILISATLTLCRVSEHNNATVFSKRLLQAPKMVEREASPWRVLCVFQTLYGEWSVSRKAVCGVWTRGSEWGSWLRFPPAYSTIHHPHKCKHLQGECLLLTKQTTALKRNCVRY